MSIILKYYLTLNSDEMDEQPKFNLQYEDFEDIVEK